MAPNPNLTIRYAEIDPDYEATLSGTPAAEDGPVWMVNLMKYREVAEYADGRETTLSGREADDTYAPLEALATAGAEIVFFADVETQVLGAEPQWDRVAVVKYPTRRSFVDMAASAAFEEKHIHKDAGMDQTIVIGARPMPRPELPADAPNWADVPHPPTADDPAIVVLHVLRFNEGGADTDMVSYQNAVGEGTILGDGRSWDQVRFNAFPSRAAFMAVVLDPARLEAQAGHREVAIADTYTMILRPVIDHLSESLMA